MHREGQVLPCASVPSIQVFFLFDWGGNMFCVREHILRDAVQCNLTFCTWLVWPGNDGGSLCLPSSNPAHNGVIKGCFSLMVGYIP